MSLPMSILKLQGLAQIFKRDQDPVYSAKKAGLGRGSARPFCHCKRTKRPNARPKTAAPRPSPEVVSAAARPGFSHCKRKQTQMRYQMRSPDPEIRMIIVTSQDMTSLSRVLLRSVFLLRFFFLLWRLPNLSV